MFIKVFYLNAAVSKQLNSKIYYNQKWQFLRKYSWFSWYFFFFPIFWGGNAPICPWVASALNICIFYNIVDNFCKKVMLPFCWEAKSGKLIFNQPPTPLSKWIPILDNILLYFTSQREIIKQEIGRGGENEELAFIISP